MSVAVGIHLAEESLTDAYVKQLPCLRLLFSQRHSPTPVGSTALPSGSEFQSQTSVPRTSAD